MIDLDELLARPVLEVAPLMLGMIVSTAIGGEVVEVELNEVEAYVGDQDPASHAFRGRTKRNGSMFGAAGTLYVYRSYGLHWCMNVVTGAVDVPHAVLLRGGVIVRGSDAVETRRGRSDHLTDGPGKLSQALGVTGEYDGTSVLDGPVRLSRGADSPALCDIEATPRIGISKAVDRPWRFVLRQRH